MTPTVFTDSLEITSFCLLEVKPGVVFSEKTILEPPSTKLEFLLEPVGGRNMPLLDGLGAARVLSLSCA